MSRKYAKGKTHGGGAGLHFDKLLKACSNSKKPSVTKTAGALGRFGIASFTSTRNSTFDGDTLSEEEARYTSFKRPRFDVEKNLLDLGGDSFRKESYANLVMPSRGIHMEGPSPLVIKPKKFFKSRNLGSDQNQSSGGSAASGTVSIHLPPLPMPITIPTIRTIDLKKPKANGRKGKNRRKDSTSSSDAEVKAFAFYNTTNVTPAATEQSNTSSTSPSIKLRIFKDKRTAKFVSVSDTTLPPKLEPQIQKDENVLIDVHPKKRGRKPKAELEPLKNKSKPAEICQPEPTVQRRSGRLTRNSSRLRSDSCVGSPVLTVADEILESEQSLDCCTQSYPEEQIVQKVDSADKLVQRLEQEDLEFRELTAMLSSMEEASDHGRSKNISQGSPVSASRSPPVQSQVELPPAQPSPINYSINPLACIPDHSSSAPIFIDTPPAETASRDFRSILEDEWDENYEDESPRRCSSISPTKVTRFDMSEFGITIEKYGRMAGTECLDRQINAQSHVPVSPHPHPQLNSSYSVRNLLSEITGCSEFHTSLPDTEERTHTLPVPDSETLEDEQSRLPLTPEKPFSSKDLIGSAKKVSIFKSRLNPGDSLSAINPKKRLALYKHKFGQEGAERQELQHTVPVMSTDGLDNTFSDSSEPLSLRKRQRVDEEGNPAGEGSKVYCSHQTKKLFTVVRNVKAIHELQESGEAHEFDGDIWYILEDLKVSNPVSSRCLSAITLATRCMEPAFRMHLRAHGTVAEFARELRDAPNNIPVLALAAATVLFVLSQDRLNMDLDTESFLLILALAKTEQNSQLLDENPELSKHKQRIIDLVEEMKSRGHAKHIKTEKITASELALETLLFLTSKRAGEWVKRELRTLGGLDYIVTEVEKSLSSLECSVLELGWSETLSEDLWKIDRCLKVLQQVTFNHEENQKYLLRVQNLPGIDLPSPLHSPELFVRLFRFLSHHLSYSGKSAENIAVLREVLFSVLRVLVNLTHDYRGIVLGSEILSGQDGFLYLTLYSIFTLSTAFVDGKGFDLIMHSLCMLLNIVEHSRKNREIVLSMTVQLPGSSSVSLQEESTLDALIQLFFIKESEAQKEEASTDDILTNSTDKKDGSSQMSESSQNISQESKDSESSSVQDIIDKLIETAGKHMENSMIAAHVSLLIAYLVMDDQASTAHLINAMPDSRLLPLMVLLKKLFNFMSITTSTAGSTRGLKATSIALKFYEQCDPESASELKKLIPD